MFCPKCGNQLKEGVKFCTKCGARMDDLRLENTSANQQQAAAKQPEAKPPVAIKPASVRKTPEKNPKDKKPTEKKGKGKTGIILLLILLLIVVLAAGMGAVYYLNQRNDAALLDSINKEFSEDDENDTETEKKPEKTESSEAESLEAETTGAVMALQDPTQPAFAAAVPTTAAMPSYPAAAVSCSVNYLNQVSLGGLIRANVVKDVVTQSSHVVQRGSSIDNTGWSAFDGQSTTSWQEGVDGDGLDQYVTAGFDREYQVKAITFLLGNHRSDSWYVKNNRPKTLTINLNGTIFQASFPDEKQEFAVVFSSPVPASAITVTISDVYKGTQYSDTTIAEVGVYGN